MAELTKCPKCGIEIEWVKHKEFKCKARQSAIKWAKDVIGRDNVVYLDLETTGFKNAGIVQIGLINYKGEVLMDTLINPERPVEMAAFNVHGISEEMTRGAPTFKEIYPELTEYFAGKHVIIYNKDFDQGVIRALVGKHGLEPMRVHKVSCAMLENAKYVGDWNERHRNFKWPKLIGGDHSAVGDCQATRQLVIDIANTI